MSRWRTGTFGPASEEPYRRRITDWIRLGTAVVLVYLIARHANDLARTEREVFQFFNTLPAGMKSFFHTLYRFGALWAVGLVVVAALVARRWRLARDLFVAGLLAWAIARALGAFVSNDSLEKSLDIVVKVGHDSPAFPQVRIAVVIAVICAASPYLTRPTRRVGALVGLAVALRRCTSGPATPTTCSVGSSSAGASPRWSTSCSVRPGGA
jgi:undecaprenyl-diphosphatase